MVDAMDSKPIVARRESSSLSPGTSMEFQYGRILPQLPDEFVPPEMWPEYGHIGDPPGICSAEILNYNPVAIRWSLWPFTFEQHWGDQEPDIKAASVGKLARNRIAFWYPLRRIYDVVPKGWRRASKKPFRFDGYQKLLDGEDFTKRWDKEARHDLRQWREQYADKTHEIVEVPQAVYDSAYRKSLIAKRLDLERLYNLNRKLATPECRAHTKLYAVRNKHTGAIVAGSAVIFSPTYRSATHFAPFIHEEGRRTRAATALVNHWFEEARRAGCPNVVTTSFWFKGKPKGWKGFSLFKSRFGWSYVTYPPGFQRFVRGKLW